MQTTTESDYIYQKPRLSLSDFAQHIHQPEYQVRKAIQSYLEAKSFSAYINQVRVNAAARLLKNPDVDMPVLSIA